MKKISLIIVFVLLNFSFAATTEKFNNISFTLPNNHYKAGTYFVGEGEIYQIQKNNSTDNIIVQKYPSPVDLGYMKLTEKEFSDMRDELINELAISLKEPFQDTTVSQFSEAWGTSQQTTDLTLNIVQNNSNITDCRLIDIPSLNLQSIRFTIYTNYSNHSSLRQIQYWIPNGYNYYYFIFTGNYTQSEIDNFLSTVKIDGLIKNNTPSIQISWKDAFVKGSVNAIVLGLVFFLISKFSKILKKIQPQITPPNEEVEIPFTENPNLSFEENLKEYYSKMDINSLKKIIDNQPTSNDYNMEKIYDIALEQYHLRTSTELSEENK